MATRSLHLAVDLSAAGARAGAWRDVGSRAPRAFDLARLAGLVATAERGTLDLVVLDDDFTVRPSRDTTLRGRLDAALVMARLAPVTRGIGLVATVGAEIGADHVGQAVATVDELSGGRAGWQVGPAARVGQPATDVVALIGAVRGTWDAAATRAHTVGVASPDRAGRGYVELDGVHVAGAAAAGAGRSGARPVQPRPPVVVRADTHRALEVAGSVADVVRVRALDAASASAQRAVVRAAAAAAGRHPDEVVVLVDVYTVIGPDPAAASARLDLLMSLDGVAWDEGSYVHVGTADALAATAAQWLAGGAADGFTVRPSSLTADLHGLVDGVVPLLRERGLHRHEYPGTTLRETLGLPLHRAHRVAG